MAHCIGIDLHKATSYVTTVDETGRILDQRNLRNEPETLRAYFGAQPPDARLVVEATGHWMWLYELLEDRYPDLGWPIRSRPRPSPAPGSRPISSTRRGWHSSYAPT